MGNPDHGAAEGTEKEGILGSMNVSETKAEGLVREYSIVITAAEIETQVLEKLAELAKTVNMPGFRPGKVPMSVVKSRFGPQAQGDAIKAALDEGAKQAIEGNDLRLASQPNVDIKSYEDGKDLEASLTCEVMPEISMPDLGKLSIERPTLEAGDEEVAEALTNIADGNKPSVAVEKKRAAKSGDILTIDFIGRIDGEAFEGGAAEGESSGTSRTQKVHMMHAHIRKARCSAFPSYSPSSSPSKRGRSCTPCTPRRTSPADGTASTFSASPSPSSGSWLAAAARQPILGVIFCGPSGAPSLFFGTNRRGGKLFSVGPVIVF